MKRFTSIYTERTQDAAWSVVQAATLLVEAKEKQCISLLLYAALEMRMAIEQLVFTIIIMANQGADEELIARCRKKDQLFEVLREVSPNYTLRCRFAAIISSIRPEIPPPAQWDVKVLKRYYTELSDLCHSQLVERRMKAAPTKWTKKIKLLEEAYEFLAEGMRKGTSVLSFKNATPVVADLWQQFADRKITEESLRIRLEILNPIE